MKTTGSSSIQNASLNGNAGQVGVSSGWSVVLLGRGGGFRRAVQTGEMSRSGGREGRAGLAAGCRVKRGRLVSFFSGCFCQMPRWGAVRVLLSQLLCIPRSSSVFATEHSWRRRVLVVVSPHTTVWSAQTSRPEPSQPVRTCPESASSAHACCSAPPPGAVPGSSPSSPSLSPSALSPPHTHTPSTGRHGQDSLSHSLIVVLVFLLFSFTVFIQQNQCWQKHLTSSWRSTKGNNHISS